jgi:hypothetical protein
MIARRVVAIDVKAPPQPKCRMALRQRDRPPGGPYGTPVPGRGLSRSIGGDAWEGFGLGTARTGTVRSARTRAGSLVSVRARDDGLDAVGVWVIERLAVLADKAADRNAVREQTALPFRP